SDVLHDMARNRYRGRRGRRWRVTDDQRAIGSEEQKVLDDFAVALDGLSADTRRVRKQVVQSKLRAILLDAPQVASLRKRVPELGQARSKVLANDLPEAGKRQHLHGVSKTEVRLAIALALERDDGVRADGHGAVDHSRQVHAEKGEGRIRDRIDQMLDDAIVPFVQHEVFASERNDLEVRLQSEHSAHAVRLQAGARDEIARGESASGCLKANFARRLADRRDGMIEEQRAASGLDELAHPTRDAGVADDPGRRHEEGADAYDVRLELA